MTRIRKTGPVFVRYELACAYRRCEQIAEQLTSDIGHDGGFCEAKDVTTGFDHPSAVLEVTYASVLDAYRLTFAVRQSIFLFVGKRRQFCVGRIDQRPVYGNKRRRWFATEDQAEQFLGTLPEADVAAGLYYLERR